jgi:hypothetical protein
VTTSSPYPGNQPLPDGGPYGYRPAAGQQPQWPPTGELGRQLEQPGDPGLYREQVRTVPDYGAGHGPAGGPGEPPIAGMGTKAPTRSNSAVLTAVLVAVLVIGGGLSAWLLSTPSYDRTTARGAAEAFAEAINSRNIDAAKELVCSQDRYQMNNAGGEMSQVLSFATLKVNGVEASQDKGTARFEVIANLGSRETMVPMQRDSDSGRWEVCFSDASQS